MRSPRAEPVGSSRRNTTTRTRSRHWLTARPRLSERSQKPPRAVRERVMSRMALTPTRPARRKSTSASLTMKLSTGLAFVLQQDAAAQLERTALELGGEAGLMGGQEHGGAAAADVLDEVEDLSRHGLVEIARGLVREEKRGRFDDGAGQGRPLGLALRELRRIRLCSRREPHRLEGLEGLRGDLASGRPEHAEHEGDVLEDGPAGEELGVLEDDAERAPETGNVRAAQGPDVEPRDLDLAFAGPLVGIEQTEEGGLARPARPAQDDELALLDAERDVAQGGQPHRPAFEDFTDVVEPDHGLRPFYLTRQTFGSFSSRSEFTTAGLALPAVAFITCPTRKPRAAFLPPFQSRTTLGCCARTSSTTAESSPASAPWVSPSRSTMARASSPERYIFSKTSLAILPLMVPSSMRVMRPARFAGRIGHPARARSSSPASSRRSSLSTQFAAALGLPHARTVDSK